jgi:hypothetical protein
MRISYKQYDEEDLTIKQLEQALERRGFTVGSVRRDHRAMCVWSVESTGWGVSLPLATIQHDFGNGLCTIVELSEEEEEDNIEDCPACQGCPDCGEFVDEEPETDTLSSFLELCSFVSSVVSGSAVALKKGERREVTWFCEQTESVIAAAMLGDSISAYINHAEIDSKSWLALKGYCELLGIKMVARA